MKSISFALLIIGFILFLGVTDAAACLCRDLDYEKIRVEKQLKYYQSRAQTVILGKIVSEENLMRDNGRYIYFDTRTTIKVERFWGLPVSDKVFIMPKALTSCDWYFEVGESYLIFINKIEGNIIYTGRCSGNINAKDATEQLKLLGEGSKPKIKKTRKPKITRQSKN